MGPQLAAVLLANGGSGGASVELLILGLAMAVLGVVFFVQKTTKPIVPVLLVLGGITVGVGGFFSTQGADEHGDGHTTAAVVDHQETVDALCEERAQVQANGDVSGDAFFDGAHAGIHEIAAQVEGADRAAAARLLEAKGAFEADLRDEDVEMRDVVRDLDELIEATIAAVSVLGEEVTPCS